MMQHRVTGVATYVFGETVGDFLFAPVWWYGRGFVLFLGRLRERLVATERRIGLRLWVRALGKPMYGERDIAGKIISFFMRLAVLFVRFIVMVLYLAWLAVLIIAWLVIPVVVVWQIAANLIGLLVV